MKLRTTLVVEYKSATPHDVCHHWTQSQQAQWAMRWIRRNPECVVSATTQPAEAPASPRCKGTCGDAECAQMERDFQGVPALARATQVCGWCARLVAPGTVHRTHGACRCTIEDAEPDVDAATGSADD